MYTLIGAAKSRAFRVMWMLEEVRQPYEHVGVPPRSKELLAVNPSGKTPAFKDGNNIIIDSVAICQYLADKHNKATYAAGSIKRAQQDSFTHFALDELDSALWWAAKHRFVLPEDLRTPDAEAGFKHDFDRGLKILAKRLGDNDFVMGKKFTVPDLLIAHCMGWGIGMFGWEVPKGKLSAYLARCRARKAFQKAWAIREAS